MFKQRVHSARLKSQNFTLHRFSQLLRPDSPGKNSSDRKQSSLSRETESTAGEEKRHCHRLVVNAFVRFYAESSGRVRLHYRQGVIQNYSSGGLFISTRHLLPAGNLVTMEILVEKEYEHMTVELQVRGVIRRFNDMPGQKGMGIEFFELNDSEHHCLQEWAIWQQSGQIVKTPSGNKYKPLYYYSKRLTEILFATVLLALLSPVMLLIGILIKLDSSGPAVFIQKRVGARPCRSKTNHIVWEIHTFDFYKFRSMYADADESIHEAYIKAFVQGTLDTSDATDTRFKLKNDPRITRMGRILRKTSLDELPQLFNVLKGEMSLVGPRPVPIYEVATYDMPHYERLAALPGITGLWQIKGRGRVTFEEMIDMDIEYVRHSSLLLDLKILFLTIYVVLTGAGAE